MTLLGTSALNAAAVAAKIGIAVGLTKVLAITIGPAGFALVAQLSNLSALLIAASGSAISAGVTKLTAENAGEPTRQQELLRTALHCAVAASAVVACGTCLFSRYLAERLLGHADYQNTILAIGLTALFASLSTVVVSFAVGRKDVGAVLVQGVVSVLFAAVLSSVLAVMGGLHGALWAVPLNQLLTAAVTAWICRGSTRVALACAWGSTSPWARKLILRFALMSAVSAMVGPLAQLAVRAHLLDSVGLAQTGHWQAVFKISDLYVQAFTATLTLYYLPRLAEISSRYELRDELARVSALMLPVAALVATGLYIWRDWIVLTLFSEEFTGMQELFGWQLIGDVLKVGSWVFGFVFVGRGMMTAYITTEVVFAASWVALTAVFTERFGIQGAPMAFAANYAAYWTVSALIVRREMARMRT